MGVRVHTVDELHQEMGHISLAVIKQLTEQKVILGLELDVKSEASFCPTCAKANPTCKPVQKNELSMSPRHYKTTYTQMCGALQPHKAIMVNSTL